MTRLDEHIWEVALHVRQNSDQFTGEDSPKEVCYAVLAERYAELQGGKADGEAVEEARDNIRSRMGVSGDGGAVGEPETVTEAQEAIRSDLGLNDDEEQSEASNDDVAAKQNELRERINR